MNRTDFLLSTAAAAIALVLACMPAAAQAGGGATGSGLQGPPSEEAQA
jgi:hypothetical protein